MANRLPTMRVGFVGSKTEAIINERDFDPRIHRKLESKRQKFAPVTDTNAGNEGNKEGEGK